jgi:SulP family sulfate permease
MLLVVVHQLIVNNSNNISTEPFYESWQLYGLTSSPSLIKWALLPQQAVMWLGMFLVVAFSSSLDVAAIEMELGLPLDYNKELFTVGLSNVASGLLGGYTGSYIFSQTIFTMRRGVATRVCGYTVAACELAVILLPVSITSYLPKLFFGSLLVLISVDLLFEWLVKSG